MNKIDLSIIIPVYNAGRFIKHCLDSIYSNINHNLNFEVILVNDGSKDSSLEVIHNYFESFNHKNHVIVTQENAGASAARNKGLDMAKGDYIWFIDADDYVEKDSLETIEDHLNSEDRDYVLKFNFNRINNGTATKNSFSFLNGDPVYFDDYNFILKHKPSFLWLTILKREIINRNNLRFINGIKNIEDFEFNTRYFYFDQKVKQIDKVLYNYVDNMDSTSRNISIDNLKKLAEDSFTVHKSLQNWRDDLDFQKDKEVVSHILNHSVMGFFFSLIYKNYPIQYFENYYKEYKAVGLLPVKSFYNITSSQKLFISLLNSFMFLKLASVLKYIYKLTRK